MLSQEDKKNIIDEYKTGISYWKERITNAREQVRNCQQALQKHIKETLIYEGGIVFTPPNKFDFKNTTGSPANGRKRRSN